MTFKQSKMCQAYYITFIINLLFLVKECEPLSLRSDTNVSNSSNITFYGFNGEDEKESPSHLLFSIALFFLLSIFVQKILIALKFPLPYKFIILTIALSFAIVCFFSPQDYFRYPGVHPRIFLTFLLPMVILKITFSLDKHLFLKLLPQIMILSIVGICIFCVFFGFTMITIMQLEHPWIFIALFGFSMATIDDPNLSSNYKEYDVLKYSVVLLEAECIVGIAVCLVGLEVCMGVVDEIVYTWYQITFILIRLISGGIIFGLIIGKCLSFVLGRLFTDIYSTISTIVVLIYFTFFICEHVLYVSGVLATFIVSFFISEERSRLTIHAHEELKSAWQVVFSVGEYVVFLEVIGCALIRTVQHFDKSQIYQYILTYFVGLLARFLVLSVLSPFVIGVKHFKMKSLLAMLWVAKKGSIQLLMVFLLYHNRSTHELASTCIGHSLVYVIMNILINSFFASSLLKAFGLSSVSKSKRLNMKNCIKFIETKKSAFISMMKMNRFLADASWVAIEQSTILNHPYLSELDESTEYESYLWRMQQTFCVCEECHRDVQVELTKKEIAQMINDTKIRILKAEKVSFVRQHERGLVSKEGLRTLIHAVESGLDSPDLKIKLDDILFIFKKRTSLDGLKDFLHALNRAEIVIKPPRKKIRKVCYKIVNSKAYDICIYIIIVLSFIAFYINFFAKFHDGPLIVVSIMFCIFLTDFQMKVVAYAHIYVREGFINYFRNYWNRFDFFLLCVNAVELVFIIYQTIFYKKTDIMLEIAILTLVQIRNLRLLKLILILHKFRYKMLSFCDKRIGKRLTFGYDIAQCLIMSYNEVLHMLPQVVEYAAIRVELEKAILFEKAIILRELCSVQKNMPWVAVIAKSDRVVRATLIYMKEAIKTLKLSGFADEYEFMKLNDSIEVLMKSIYVKKLRPSTPEAIFQELPFLAKYKDIDFLFKNSIMISWNAGETIVSEGEMPNGIYIIVEGLATLHYDIEDEALNKLLNHGAIPIKEYIGDIFFHKVQVQCLIAGNSIGELSFLTKRPYSCTLRCKVPTKAYLIPTNIMEQALQKSNDIVNGLYSKMWKHVSVNMASKIMWESSVYKAFTVEELYIYMEKAFVPNLSNRNFFQVTDEVEDIVLIEGMVTDANSGAKYIAPCYIPRSAHKLYLVKNEELNIDPKLFIVPLKDTFQYSILNYDENPGDRCLLHGTRKIKKYRDSFVESFSGFNDGAFILKTS